MGISTDVHNVLRVVKGIPDIPDDVYKKLKRKFDVLEDEIKDIDIKKYSASILGQVQQIMEESTQGIELFVDGKIKESQDYVQNSLNSITEVINQRYQGIEGFMQEIPKLFQQSVNVVNDLVLNPVKGFFKKYFLPLIIAGIALIISPFLAPLISFLL